MNIRVTHISIPISLSLIALIGSIFALYKEDEINLVVILIAISTFFINSFLAYCNYIDKKKSSENSDFTLSLIRKPDLKIEVESKYDSIESIHGILQVKVYKNGKIFHIFEKTIGLAEINSAKFEYDFINNTVSSFSTKEEFKNSLVRIFFIPTDQSLWTRNIYSRDNLSENLDEAPINEFGEKNILIYTHELKDKIDEYLQNFKESSKVYKVIKNGNFVEKIDKLPNVLSLCNKVIFKVNREILFSEKLFPNNFYFHYAMGATQKKGIISKFIIFCSIEVAFEVNSSSEFKLIDWSPDHQAFQNELTLAIRCQDSDKISEIIEKYNFVGIPI